MFEADNMKIAIASDHAGYRVKEELKKCLNEKGYDIVDFGCSSEDSVDYPDFASKVARAVSKGDCERGILVCGTGLGMCIASNKVAGIRAVACWSEETAELSRKHNDANVLCIGSRVLTMERINSIVDVWLKTEFEAGRHEKRVNKIKDMEG